MHFTCIWVDLGCGLILQEPVFQDQVLKSSSLSKKQVKKCRVFKARQLLDTSRQLGYLSSLLRCFLSQSRHLLDSWSIDREIFCLLDGFSTPGGSIEMFLDICSTPYLLSFTKFSFSNMIFSPCLCVCVGFLFSQPQTYIRLILEAVTKQNTRRNAKGDRCLILSKRSYCVFASQGFVTNS